MITARLNKHGQSQAFDSCSILPEVKRGAGEVGYARDRGEFLMPGSVFTWDQVTIVLQTLQKSKQNKNSTVMYLVAGCRCEYPKNSLIPQFPDQVHRC
jgi:hypothetical protein